MERTSLQLTIYMDTSRTTRSNYSRVIYRLLGVYIHTITIIGMIILELSLNVLHRLHQTSIYLQYIQRTQNAQHSDSLQGCWVMLII